MRIGGDSRTRRGQRFELDFRFPWVGHQEMGALGVQGHVLRDEK